MKFRYLEHYKLFQRLFCDDLCDEIFKYTKYSEFCIYEFFQFREYIHNIKFRNSVTDLVLKHRCVLYTS